MTHANELLENPEVVAATRDLSALVQWLNVKYSGITLPGDKRAALAIGCLDMAMEHQMAIELLARGGLFGSMLGIMRLLFEALVRGVWLARRATEPELEYFVKHDEIKLGFEKLVTEAEAAMGHTTQVLLKLKKQSWGAMSSFTHTGMMQITRRFTPDTTGPNYTPDDVIRCMNGAGVLGLFAAMEMATIANNEPLALETFERSKVLMR